MPDNLFPLIVKDYLPLQQGLRLSSWSFTTTKHRVKDYLPLQQGLRLAGIVSIRAGSVFGQRLSSITTRIKTTGLRSLLHWGTRQRLSSITTRIKTKTKTRTPLFLCVKDYLPLQQGLRHDWQGLWQVLTYVKDYLPLQQGLRPPSGHGAHQDDGVKDYLPLQQGLRLTKATSSSSNFLGQRLSSITTRIKTPYKYQTYL